jgi:SurA N-terminal domain
VCRLRSRAFLALVVVACLSATTGASAAEGPPPGYVAVVSGLPGQLGRLTMKQFEQRKGQVRAERRAGLGGGGKTSVGEESLRQMLEEVDIEGEAERRGLSVSEARVAHEFRRVKGRDFPSIKKYRAFLEELRLTEAEARHRVKIQLLQKRIEERVTAGVPRAHRIAALLRFNDVYERRWRSRTACRAALATDRCSNGPPLPVPSASADLGGSGSPR